MAYRCISPNFWSDPKVDDDFTPEDKYFYLYLLTNPHTTLSGCYELGKRQACRELGYNEDTVDRLIHRMEYVHKVIRYDKTTKEVLILNWHKYNWSKSPKCLKGVEYTLKDIKSEAFRKYCVDMLSIRYQYPMDTTVSVSVPVSETVSVTDISSIEEPEVLDIPEPQPTSRKRFSPPSLNEVRAYFLEKGATFTQAERFYDYYESNGWRVGKNQMKKWKSAASGWISRDRERQQARPPQNTDITSQLNRVLGDMDAERGFLP